jgi:hypothetical protein
MDVMLIFIFSFYEILTLNFLILPKYFFKFLTEPDNLLKCSAYPEMNFKLFLKFFLKFFS